MVNTVITVLVILAIVAVVLAIKKQARVTRSLSTEEQSQNSRVFEESSKRMELTVAEALAEKARDPRLATMTQEDLAYEVLKECFDPEIPLNIVDLGLIYGLHLEDDDSLTIDMTLTSAACPLTDVIEDQTQTALEGLVDRWVINWVWMPPWGMEMITDDGRDQLRALGFNV